MANKSSRYLIWKEGVCYPVANVPVTPAIAKHITAAAAACPFEPRDGYADDARFEGLSNLEVAAIRRAEAAAYGDLESQKWIHERIEGKPRQQIESLTVTATYKDYLAELAKREAENPTPHTDVLAAIPQFHIYEPSDDIEEAEVVDDKGAVLKWVEEKRKEAIEVISAFRAAQLLEGL